MNTITIKNNKFYIQALVVLVMCLVCSGSFYAQTYSIDGPTTANVGETKPYIFSDTNSNTLGSGYSYFWYVGSGATITESSSSSYLGYNDPDISISWSSAGTKSITVDVDDDFFTEYYYDNITVTIISPVSTPTLSSVTHPTCSLSTGSFSITNYNASYTYSVVPSSGVTISGATITAPQGTYYVSATLNGNTSASASKTVNAQPSTPSTPSVGTITQPTISVSTGSVVLSNLPTGTWVINPGNITGSGSSKTVIGLSASTTYNFTATNASGCISAASSNVVINAQPTASTCGPSDENYVYTITPQIESTDVSQITQDDNKIESIAYFDGLGRPLQSIGIRAGGNREDIITHIAYDEYGRQDKDYLPYAETTQCGTYRADTENATKNYYYNATRFDDDFIGLTQTTINPYSQKELEASPLGRVFKQSAPGADWALGGGNEIEFDYETYTASGTNVRIYSVSLSFANNTYTPTLTGGTSNYEAGKLYKTVTKDENHSVGNDHTTEEFKNKQGQVILKRTYESGVEHDTYYVYDDYGNLTYVLPPKMDASSTTNISTIISQLNDLGYQYKYDNRNRLVEKRIPGKDWEYIVYNNLDHPILTQDAIQKQNGEWLFTKYDAFGRVAYTGKATSVISTTRKAVQAEVNAINGNLWVTQSTNSTNYGGVNMFYNNGAYPTTGLVTLSEILTINYYDSYVDRPTSAPTSVVLMESATNETNTTYVKGLATVSKVKVLDVTGTNVWINTLSYYDTKSRPIYVYNENTYLGTVDIIESKLDFVGKPLKSKTTHTRNGITIATIDNYTYDHAGRLLTQTQCIGDQTMGYTCSGSSATAVDLALTGDITTDQVASNSIIITNGTIFPDTRLWISPEIQEVIADNTYDALGQLESKGVGGILNTNRLQTVDYTYNVRGWLKQINDPTTLGNDLFSFKINYNTTELGSTNTELYNGNISETIWKTANDDSSNSTRAYAYTYDALNRITSADYGIKSSSSFNLSSGFDVGIDGYDKNGNILSLWRDNITDNNKIDQLTYAYDNNEVSNKLKVVNDTSGSTEGFNNGASSTDEYSYDVNGNMTQDDNKGITAITYNHLNLPTQVTLASGNISYIYDATGVKLKKTVSTGATTEYAGNYVYENSSLKFFNHPEGYVDVDNGAYEYVYQYKDHLGNVRLSYKDNNGTLEILEENNYYPFGLKHKGYNNNVTSTNIALKRKFGGKEYQDELGLDWYDITARNYDPAIGRWMNLDPLAEQMRKHSPYNYVFDNPIRFIDPDGMAPVWEPLGNGRWKAQAGDSASTLARDANITFEEAKVIMANTKKDNILGNMGTYIDSNDGIEKSAVDTGDVVDLNNVDFSQFGDNPVSDVSTTFGGNGDNGHYDQVTGEWQVTVGDSVSFSSKDFHMFDMKDGIDSETIELADELGGGVLEAIFGKGAGMIMSTQTLNDGETSQLNEYRARNIAKDAAKNYKEKHENDKKE
ncbi:DUF6443 domain-containing protein [Flavivirga jejuensis]|uniref:DUF6443 domain-containing protein n=1 Tax=Flavivirga jejuensis TaxID=870487 RepID=A0ABT8WQ48_9FLAO|nr:DUF6443 domain-containing protein [Flavivirga jejuensis]MDO5975290.1 DUF6443 domain-containing protein [Flavivirga jejuensis]